MNWGTRLKIREIYKDGKTFPSGSYPLDWELIFTPIEKSLWVDIRAYDLPFQPQYPVLNYFADFADPHKKIAIEADGAKYHQREKDRDRDRNFALMGWTVYRVGGRDCCNPAKSVSELEERLHFGDITEEQHNSGVKDFFENSSEGLVYSIAATHYGMQVDEKYLSYVCSVMHDHWPHDNAI